MDLFAKDGLFTVLYTNIQTLLLEMYKIKHILSESYFKDLFSVVNNNYNLWPQFDFRVSGISAVFYGAILVKYFGLVIWYSLPNDLKNIYEFDFFKTAIQRWKPVDCPSRLCKTYLEDFGFISVSN